LQHVIIRKPGFEDYFISFRKYLGWKFPVDRDEILWVYLQQKDGFIKHLDPGMKVGEKLVLPNGATIHYHEYSDEIGRVTVQINPEDPMPDSVPMPIGFPESIKSANILPSHQGAWYDRRYGGQGFNIFVKPGKVFTIDGKEVQSHSMALYWYTFDADQHPIFYYGFALDFTDIPEFTLYATKGGTWDNPTTAVPYVAGTAKLEFLDDLRGIFHFNTTLYGRGAIEITPIARLADSPINGIWYEKATTGSGFTFLVFENGVIAGDWYVQDEDMWYSCEGTTEDYVMRIYKVVGGEWCYFSRVERLDCGTAILDPATMVLTYDIDAPKIKDSGTRNLGRAF